MQFANFVTQIPAHWANDANALIYDVFSGATTVAGARAALDLGDMALASSASVVITGGTIEGVNIGAVTPGTGRFTTAHVATAPTTPTGVVNKAHLDAALLPLSTVGNLGTQDKASVEILGGNIDGTAIGTNSAAAGRFSSLSVNQFPGGPEDVVNRDYLDTQLAALPNFGTMATQNAANVNVIGGAINNTGIGLSGAANAKFLSVALDQITSPLFRTYVDGSVPARSDYGFYGEVQSPAKPHVGFRLGNSGAFSVFNDSSLTIFALNGSTGRALFSTTDDGVNQVQVGGAVRATSVVVSSPILLNNQVTTKQYVDSADAVLQASITALSGDFAGLGNMSAQDSSTVAILGGTLNNVDIGATFPGAAAFTNVKANTINNVTSVGSISLTGTGNRAVRLIAGSASYPNVSTELNAGGEFVVEFGANKILRTLATGRVLVGVGGIDDGVNALQVKGTAALEGVKFTGPQSVGAGSALLGANCPATTPAAPQKWVSVVLSDGSNGFIPVWV